MEGPSAIAETRSAYRRGASLNRCLLDSDILSNYLRGHPRVVQLAFQYLQVYDYLELSVISYYELRRGLVRIGATQRLLELDEVVARCQLWDVTQSVVLEASALAGRLETQGKRLDDADILIGATARLLGVGIATGNVRHFSRIEGLTVENWLTGVPNGPRPDEKV